MLSLVGSIQDDPFSPIHTPTTKFSETSDAEKVQVDNQLRELTPDEDNEESDSDGEEDTFATLGKKADEAKKRAEAERQTAQEKKKKKRKNADLDGETNVKKKKKSSTKDKDKKS